MTPAHIVCAWTKADLREPGTVPSPADAIGVSAVTGAGVEALRSAILSTVTDTDGLPDTTAPAISSARQRAALELARDELRQFLSGWEAEALPVPVIATHLRAATSALDGIIGVVDTDDILARVFSSFCVGK